MKLAKSWILQNFDKRIQGNLFWRKILRQQELQNFFVWVPRTLPKLL